MIKRQQYPDALTVREVQVLELVAQGRRNKDIATLLHISLATVENHLHHIYGKLGISNRTEAARYLLQGTSDSSEDEWNPS